MNETRGRELLVQTLCLVEHQGTSYPLQAVYIMDKINSKDIHNIQEILSKERHLSFSLSTNTHLYEACIDVVRGGGLWIFGFQYHPCAIICRSWSRKSPIPYYDEEQVQYCLAYTQIRCTHLKERN